MSADRRSHRHDDSSDRRLPSIREKFGDLLDQPVWSGRRDYRPAVSSSDYYRSSSGRSSPHASGDYAASYRQEPHSYPVQRHSDPYQQHQQHSREPRDGRRSDVKEPHSYHVYSLTEGGLVHQSSSREDSFRLRPRKADPGNPARKYICDECDGSFDRPSALDTHMRSHSGEKPFQCSHPGCVKGFSSMSNKTRHEKTHYATSAFEDADQSRSSSSSRERRGNSAASYYYHSSRGR